MTKKAKILLLFVALFLASFFIFSQPSLAVDAGINEVDQNIDLSGTDPRIMAARIIQVALGLLGIIAVGIIVYAGFVWMSSGGNEEKVESAKRILRNAVIGLVIVLSSFGIASFILNRLITATGGVPTQLPSDSIARINRGLGAIGSCTVERTYPEPGQRDVPRNSAIMITFKESLDPQSICGLEVCNNNSIIADGRIKVYQTEAGVDSALYNISASIDSTGHNLILLPSEYLGNSSGVTWYTVYLSNDIEDSEGRGIFRTCSSDYLEWQFEVSDTLDLTPPQVKAGAVFPAPDDGRDQIIINSEARAATGVITVISQPQVYSAALVNSVSKNPLSGSWDTAVASMDSNYHGQLNEFVVVVASNGRDAELYNNSRLLAAASFDDNTVIFPDYLSLSVASSNYSAGSSWLVRVNPEVAADSLVVGSETYYFVSGSANQNEIAVSSNRRTQALNIAAALSGHPNVQVEASVRNINVAAKVAGEAGNNLIFRSNSQALVLEGLSGGQDRRETLSIVDQRDQPMNAVIQLNFNETVNPLHVSGTAEEVKRYIAVVNLDTDEIVPGTFVVSNNYRTVEFVSDNKCGVNGCGEAIYCLPANSHLEVRVRAAALAPCATEADCVSFSPYNSCNQYCQNSGGQNYPLADLSKMDGIMDAAMNSLDGNRDSNAIGPVSYYNENQADLTQGDSYRWSFYINDKIESTPPVISLADPSLREQGIDASKTVDVNFNKLMMNKSLETGKTVIDNGQSEVEHKLINLKSLKTEPLGYWVVSDNVDVSPLDGQPDITLSKINHSLLSDANSYISQLGSGVKDIYQNCFKPSAGPDCSVNASNPSCCFGIATSELDEEGNCVY